MLTTKSQGLYYRFSFVTWLYVPSEGHRGTFTQEWKNSVKLTRRTTFGIAEYQFGIAVHSEIWIFVWNCQIVTIQSSGYVTMRLIWLESTHLTTLVSNVRRVNRLSQDSLGLKHWILASYLVLRSSHFYFPQNMWDGYKSRQRGI